MWRCVILHKPDRATIRFRTSLNPEHNSEKYVLGVAFSRYLSPMSFQEKIFPFLPFRKGAANYPTVILPLLFCDASIIIFFTCL